MMNKKLQSVLLFCCVMSFTQVSEANFITKGLSALYTNTLGKLRKADNNANSAADSSATRANNNNSSADPGARQTELSSGGSDNSSFRIEDAFEVVTPFSAYRGGRMTVAGVTSKLMRKTKAAVTLVAPAGAGKSEFFRHLKHLIDTKDMSVRPLHGMEMIYLNPKTLMGNTSHRGDFEGRLDQLLRYLKDPNNRGKILVIDELQELFNSGDMGHQLLDTLKPYLTSDMPVKLVFGITPGPYRQHMTDPQLVRRIQPVFFNPPHIDVVRLILQNSVRAMYLEEGVRFTPEQIEAVLRVTQRQSRLANPDAALTILENAKNLARAAMSSDTPTMIRVRDRLESVQGRIERLESLRQDGYAAYSGPHYERQLQQLKGENEALTAAIQAYDRAFVDTQPIREQLENLIEQRARQSRQSQQQNLDKLANDDLASTPLLTGQELDNEIESLSRQIGERTQILQNLDVSDEQLIMSARDQLQLEEAVVRAAWNGPQGTQRVARQILDELNGEYEEVVQAIVSRLRSQRSLEGSHESVPTFLIVGSEPQEADAIARATAESFTGLRPYRIDGREVRTHADMTQHMGANPGYVGYVEGRMGPFLEYVHKANGNVGLMFQHIDQGDPSVQRTLSQILESGDYRANTGEIVDFRNSVIFSSLKDRGSDEAKRALRQSLSEAPDEISRQAVLREYVTANHPGAIPDDMLRQMQIIHLENTGNMRLQQSIRNKLSSKKMAEAFGENLGLTINFSDDFVESMAQMARRQGGDQEINNIIVHEILPFITRQIDEGQLVQGDVATLTVRNGHYEINITPWSTVQHRQQTLQSTIQSGLGGDQLRPTNDEALDALTEALRLMD